MQWMPKDPTVNRPVSTCLNKKHKVSWQFMTTGSARNKQKNTRNEWYLEWFVYSILHGTTKIDATPLGSSTPTNWLKTTKLMRLNALTVISPNLPTVACEETSLIRGYGRLSLDLSHQSTIIWTVLKHPTLVFAVATPTKNSNLPLLYFGKKCICVAW